MLYRTEAESKDPAIDQLSFTELRDQLLALDPLDKDHVIRINKAEAEYWKKSEGYRMGWSDEILGFDCGGQQWVSETCFPTGTLAKPSMKDLDYMEELLQLIEKEDIPAPAPIEQRWTARSRSPMSPASSSEEDEIFSWVTCSSVTLCCCCVKINVISSVIHLEFFCMHTNYFLPVL
jgi:L-galactono-1,4-lactone dehydrogenase